MLELMGAGADVDVSHPDDGDVAAERKITRTRPIKRQLRLLSSRDRDRDRAGATNTNTDTDAILI